MTKRFQNWNIITGWMVFAISLIVYFLTLEPTASFWDCGEFILCSYRLEVGHPPGAPLFLMLGRFFSLFAGSDTSKVAVMVNILSAFASAFTILFMFWSITRLIRMAYGDSSEMSTGKAIAILASGAVGSLAYAFSDTAWFSAVEGEVYGTSSLFTALVFWAMLRWYDEADDPHGNRWIILIAYLMGLSIGVHLLNLLTLPVLVLLYYFRKHEVTRNGVIKAVLLSFVLLGILNFIFIPGVAKVAGWFELLFVNTFGLPYNSGLYFYLILFVALIILGIRYSIQKKKVLLNYILTIVAVIMLGYSSFAMIIIRANAHPPMDQNDPSDVFSFIYYINRTQYGSTPVIYGPYYSAPVVRIDKKIAGYNKEGGKYEPYYIPEYKYDKRFCTLFPRMYSADPVHISEYEHWGKISGHKVTIRNNGQNEQLTIPSFVENLRFFFRYQVGYMYMRYLMWDYVGRQNDVQGNGNMLDGNWISGIPFIDNLRLGDQDLMPEDMKTNPARNTYFFIPLLAAIAGIFWQFRRDKKGFSMVLLFFVMTGLAIVVYLNQTPNQPRERDYAYAGSIYAFAFWVGMGMMACYELLKKLAEEKISAIIPAVLLMIAVPLLMLVQNYDDHDRSGRYTARDIASNYLSTCDENAILLTYGDNDSFPLWYIQDVEGFRTDLRIANLSYLQSGFYIEAMNQKAFKSDPLPFTLPPEKYVDGERVQMPVEDLIKEPYDIKKIVEFVGSDDPKAKVDLSGDGDYYNFIPVKEFIVDVDSLQVLKNGAVRPYHANRMLIPMLWKFKGSMASKNDLALMDIIAGNDWKRPVYYAVTVPGSTYIGLENFFVLEGMAYRISPIKIDKPEPGETGMIDTQVMYDRMMNRFKWGNAEKPGVYLDENNRRLFDVFRRQFGRLALALASEGDTVRAVAAAERGLSFIPPERLPYDYFSVDLCKALARAGRKDEASRILNIIMDNAVSYLRFISSLPVKKMYGSDFHSGISLQAIIDSYKVADEYGLTDIAERANSEMTKYYGKVPVQ